MLRHGSADLVELAEAKLRGEAADAAAYRAMRWPACSTSRAARGSTRSCSPAPISRWCRTSLPPPQPAPADLRRWKRGHCEAHRLAGARDALAGRAVRRTGGLHRPARSGRALPRRPRRATASRPSKSSERRNRRWQIRRFSTRACAMAQRIAIASDHAAFALKAALVDHLRDAGHEVVDLGPDGVDCGRLSRLRLSSSPRRSRPARPTAAWRCAAPASASRSRSTAIPACRCALVSEPLSARSPASIMTPTSSPWARG